MWKNYLIIVYRNIKKNLGYSLINFIGLSVGLAGCILILLWVQDELSYDRFHANKGQLYRLICQEIDAKDETGAVYIPFALAPILKREFPEILEFSRYQSRMGQETPLLAYGDKKFYESGMSLVDPSFFLMFSFAFIKGNPQTALQDPDSVVITEEMADKYFGTEEPLGKILKYNNRLDLKVTGVLKKIPPNSHLKFDFIASIQMLGTEKLNSWSSESLSYILLKPNTRLAELREKIAGSMTKFWRETQLKINLQPLIKIHLYQGEGDIKLVYIFSVIAIFILLIACINYMNLASARSARRAKEVGLRKVMGAKKAQLVKQFLGETLMLSSLAAIMALLLVHLSLGVFNNLTQKKLSMEILNNPTLLLGLASLILLVSLLSGSYPALILSAYKPVNVLKNNVLHGSRGTVFRKIMVIGQFTISIILLICTFIIHQQLYYIQNKELGWNRENLVVLPINVELAKQLQAFKNQLKQNPKIVNVTATSSIPTRIGHINGIDWWEGKSADDEAVFKFVITDHDYVDTFGMKIKEGRNFNINRPTDIANFIINEAGVKAMKLKNPVDKSLRYMRIEGHIIGVVEDFHFRHFSEPIYPLILVIDPQHYDYFLRFVFAKIQPFRMQETLDYIKNVYAQYAPHYPFEYKFVDEEFNRLYKYEQYVSRIVNYFTFLALIIACLGLFGMSSFMTESRKKEIGMRKVLGASARSIVLLFTREFYKWVFIASIIACPIAYYAMNQWLSGYAYRIPLLWWPFALACVLAFLTAGLTVSYQTIRAAYANPVESLRTE